VTAVKHMSMEKLIDEAEHAEPGVTAPYRELRVRLTTLRRLVSGDRAAIDAVLNGEPLSFVQLLDKIMDEMDAAGVADIQARSIEETENEPHRAAAFDYRAILEERFEKLSGPWQRLLDGRA
jgi:hypothetical protein